MRTSRKFIAVFFAIVTLGMAIFVLAHGHTIAVLQPAGHIASRERSLMILATILMLVIVLPVFALTIGIAWRYRASNTTATYRPDWDHNNKLEFIWWVFPLVIVSVLAVVTWSGSLQVVPPSLED